jgi:hypothetical protein
MTPGPLGQRFAGSDRSPELGVRPVGEFGQ